jgi:Tol biopolymer transport system component
MGIEAAGAVSARSPASRSTSSPTVSARPRIEPQAPWDFLFASNRISGHILFSKGRDHRLIPDSDAPSGRDLWVRAGAGADRLIHSSVLSARFSPEGQRVAYTTTDRALLIEDLQGNKLAEVAGAYSPQWKPDGSAIVFAKVPEGRNVNMPGSLHLATLDPASGKVELLTDGQFDDVRPEFAPSGDWILFVSGGRTGLASFWKLDLSGSGTGPAQVTNIGQQGVDERFVPTPYHQTLWSPDGRWFIYDFKSGDREQVWGLQFAANGALARTAKLADGLDPHWQEEGKSFVYTRRADGHTEKAMATLP